MSCPSLCEELEINQTNQTILLTGATGYIGGRLLPLLENSGSHLRCLTRRPESLEHRVNAATKVVQGDLMDLPSLQKALEGVDTAYYFIHSMGSGRDFAEQDRQAARNFAQAASANNVRRIVYLGGLGEPGNDLSKHLKSRQETGEILRTSSAQVVEFRASIIIGSGSLSFELIRALVERLPVMICPRWVRVKAQPIAIEDVLAYLIESLDLPAGDSRIFEIGGPDQVSYGEIMREYADQRGLKRLMIPVPLLTPHLSSLWLGLVTPLYSRIGRQLVDSMRNETVVTNSLALDRFGLQPKGIEAAIERALVNEDREIAETRWSDAFSSGSKLTGNEKAKFGSRLIDARCVELPLPPQETFAPVQRIGGRTGWYYGNWLWRVRGLLDLMVGGVGIRRGRRDPNKIFTGEALDFWRVEEIKSNQLLRLRAEMRIPGRAWLEFEVRENNEGGSMLYQTAIFDPIGLFGILYWYSVLPLHQLIFSGMLKNIAVAALKGSESESIRQAKPQVHRC